MAVSYGGTKRALSSPKTSFRNQNLLLSPSALESDDRIRKHQQNRHIFNAHTDGFHRQLPSLNAIQVQVCHLFKLLAFLTVPNGSSGTKSFGVRRKNEIDSAVSWSQVFCISIVCSSPSVRFRFERYVFVRLTFQVSQLFGDLT